MLWGLLFNTLYFSLILPELLCVVYSQEPWLIYSYEAKNVSPSFVYLNIWILPPKLIYIYILLHVKILKRVSITYISNESSKSSLLHFIDVYVENQCGQVSIHEHRSELALWSFKSWSCFLSFYHAAISKCLLYSLPSSNFNSYLSPKPNSCRFVSADKLVVILVVILFSNIILFNYREQFSIGIISAILESWGYTLKTSARKDSSRNILKYHFWRPMFCSCQTPFSI